MSDTMIGGRLGAATSREHGSGLVRLLRLAAAPTFAAMALLTGLLGAGAADLLCSSSQPGLPLNGMVVMYTLMSIFHAPPWLALMPGARGAAGEAHPRERR